MRVPAVEGLLYAVRLIPVPSTLGSFHELPKLVELCNAAMTSLPCISRPLTFCRTPCKRISDPFPMVVPKALSQWQAYAGAVLRAGLRQLSAHCLGVGCHPTCTQTTSQTVAAPFSPSSHLTIQQPILPLQQPLEVASLYITPINSSTLHRTKWVLKTCCSGNRGSWMGKNVDINFFQFKTITTCDIENLTAQMHGLYNCHQVVKNIWCIK